MRPDDFRALLARAPEPFVEAKAAARLRNDSLTKPTGALGRLEDLAVWFASWRGAARPKLERAEALIFAGNHGVAAQGVSPYPAEVTAQMVTNFERGGAAINQLCGAAGAGLRVIALDLDRPTRDFTQGPAMDEADFSAALKAGYEAVDPAVDALIVGEMGIGNTTSAAALCAALYGGGAADWAGPGAGAHGPRLAHKMAVIDAGLALHSEARRDPLEALRRLGGREIAAIAGTILAARMNRVPVLLDGYICGAAAAVLEAVRPGALDHCVAGHVSAEPAHARLLERMGKAPILSLGMRLGEGSGAATALLILRAALATHNGMASFAEAGVSSKDA